MTSSSRFSTFFQADRPPTPIPEPGLAVDCGRNVIIKTFFTFTHLKKAEEMKIGTQFWLNLFSVHNLFTCDSDDRACPCKKFFNGDVWRERFEAFVSEIEDLYYCIYDLLKSPHPDLLLPRSERYGELQALYNVRSAEIVSWQGIHASYEEAMLTRRLCQECKTISANFKQQARDFLLRVDPTPRHPPSPVVIKR
mgnify:CR=1 FL=1